VKNSKIKKILIVFGTRPEAIKLAPVINELTNCFTVEICVTAQHRSLLDQVLNLFSIKPDYDLDIMSHKQDLFDVTTRVLNGLKEIILISKPDLVLVHGDTTTAMASSMASFYLKIPLGQIEAGLRTNNIFSPFPEEFNRQLVSKLTKFHFAPTLKAKENLLNEQINNQDIYVTGNTVIDALFSIIDRARKTSFPDKFKKQMPFLFLKEHSERVILVTGHRRENFGKGFEEICLALKEIALQNINVQIVYPVHLNPNVKKPVNLILSNISNIHLVEPLDYLTFVKLMDESFLILTDSGGIQEEAPSLGKPVLLMRDSTERPEALDAGTVKLVGSDKSKIISSVNLLLNDSVEYRKMSRAHNPYGDGTASIKINSILKEKINEG
jgi:UDP-N-acetylglucosamine 2-epimerase (non-hydrolysing)